MFYDNNNNNNNNMKFLPNALLTHQRYVRVLIIAAVLSYIH